MSVTVKHLTSDTSFLLTLSPDPSDTLQKPNRSFTILVDPWLDGPAIVGASWFATTVHSSTPACIDHLSEIPEPDIVLVSANHTDHCHRATLCQLKPHAHSLIVAEPAAAKSILGYRHFDPTKVHALSKFDPHNPSSLFRVRIPPLSPTGLPGQVTIAFIPAKNYLTGLHNAVGITYEPPTGTRVPSAASSIELPIQHFPQKPPQAHRAKRDVKVFQVEEAPISKTTNKANRTSIASFDMPIQKPPSIHGTTERKRSNRRRKNPPSRPPTKAFSIASSQALPESRVSKPHTYAPQENTVRFDLPSPAGTSPSPPGSPPLTGSTLAQNGNFSQRLSAHTLDSKISEGNLTTNSRVAAGQADQSARSPVSFNTTAPLGYPQLHEGLTTAINATPPLPAIGDDTDVEDYGDFIGQTSNRSNGPPHLRAQQSQSGFRHQNGMYTMSHHPIPLPSPPLATSTSMTSSSTRLAEHDQIRPKPVSILYTPHGFSHPPMPDPNSPIYPLPSNSPLTPYAIHHLYPLGALPLTLLLHSFDRIYNPWFLGGVISVGAEQGVLVAKALNAKAWVSAHDEDKTDTGCSLVFLKKRRMGVSEVRRLVGCFGGGGLGWRGEVKGDVKSEKMDVVSGNGATGGVGGWLCDVRSLDAGAECVVDA